MNFRKLFEEKAPNPEKQLKKSVVDAVGTVTKYMKRAQPEFDQILRKLSGNVSESERSSLAERGRAALNGIISKKEECIATLEKSLATFDASGSPTTEDVGLIRVTIDNLRNERMEWQKYIEIFQESRDEHPNLINRKQEHIDNTRQGYEDRLAILTEEHKVLTDTGKEEEAEIKRRIIEEVKIEMNATLDTLSRRLNKAKES